MSKNLLGKKKGERAVRKNDYNNNRNKTKINTNNNLIMLHAKHCAQIILFDSHKYVILFILFRNEIEK